MKFSKEIMLKYIDEFKNLHDKRPIKSNIGGMNSSHMLPVYVYCKEMKPKLIIESGIWMGQGTWLFENCSDAKILSIDINLSKRTYISDKVTYFGQDIMSINIDDILKEYNNDDILIFLDDHQDFNKRLDFFLERGIKHIIYEDNYPSEQGDCLSVKKIIEGGDYVIDRGGNRTHHKLDENERDSILSQIDYYEEFSPIFDNDVNRWGTNWYDYNTKYPILDKSEKDKYPQFYEDRLGYTWISYVRLKNKK